MTDATAVSEPDAASIFARVAFVAALGVALGFGMQLFLLSIKMAAGAMPPAAALAADIAGGIAWGSIVCAGTAVGVSLARAKAIVCGMIAGLFAPLAVAASKAVNQIVASAVGAVGQPAALTTVALAATKAVEYGLLGFLLATLAKRGATRLAPYVGVGAAVGLVFAAIALALRMSSGATAVQLASLAVNEALFPIGCSAAVYAGVVVARLAKEAPVTASTG